MKQGVYEYKCKYGIPISRYTVFYGAVLQDTTLYPWLAFYSKKKFFIIDESLLRKEGFFSDRLGAFSGG